MKQQRHSKFHLGWRHSAYASIGCNRQVSTQTITPEERKHIAELFAEIDTDGSGGLDINEMKVLCVLTLNPNS
jgi:hypothetical protein